MKSMITICVLMLCIITKTKSEMSPSLSPSTSCSSIIYDMVDCVPFLSSDSTTDETPSHGCCSGFKTILDTNAECICEALKSSVDLGADVNLTKASMLPSACKVSVTPISACDLTVSSSPGAAPGTHSVPGPSNAPSPSPLVDDPTKHAPSPLPSGSYSLSYCFFALLSMLVISFSYISV